MHKEVVLVTGISSGFGKEIAQLLAEKGFKVYGTSRREITCDPRISLVEMDITDVASVQKGVQQIIKTEGHIDILINNAGMGISGSLEETSDAEMRLQMDTNFFGMVYLVQAALPSMRVRKSGKIINISSLAGLMGLPYQGFYAASKYAIEGFTDSLRMEVHEFGVKVVLVNPGDFATHFTQNRKQDTLKSDSPYAASFARAMAVIEKDETHGLHPIVLAKKVVSIVEKSNPCSQYIVASAEQKLALCLKTLLPSRWFYAILRSHYQLK